MPGDLRRRVELALKKLSRANRAARLSGSVRSRYDFARRVYRVSQAFSKHSQSKTIARMLGSKPSDPPDFFWFIRRVLRRTSKDDRRLRSKHAAALTYAAVHRVSPDRVRDFIQEKGGFNKCAEHLRRRRQKGLSLR
jgi:hypothetical protein